MNDANMTNRVALVTGASRGAGRGIAAALGEAGMTVYVTGRKTGASDSGLPGTIFATAAEVTERGGHGIAVACDHDDDAQVAALMRQIQREQGHRDLLVRTR